MFALPDRIIQSIFLYCDLNTVINASEINHLLKHILQISKKILRLDIIANNKDDFNFVRRLQECPKIEKLSFADYQTNYKLRIPALSLDHSNVIRPFLLHIKENYPKNLKHLSLGELLPRDQIAGLPSQKSFEIQQMLAFELTKECFNVLITTQIVSLKILFTNFSDNDEEDILLSLEKAVNLTSLHIYSHTKYHQPVIYLSKCLKLNKIRFEGMCIASKTVKQLKLCKNLTHLSLSDCERTSSKAINLLDKFFKSEPASKLKVLNFINFSSKSLCSDSVQIFKNLKNLEVFSYQFFCMSDKQLLSLGKNCRKLTELSVCSSDMTEQGLEKFAEVAKNLKKLSLSRINQKRQKGLCDLIHGSSDLEDLELRFSIDLSVNLFATINKCKKFTSLRFKTCSFSGISLDNLRDFVRDSPNLKYIGINLCEFISNEDALLLKKEFPRVEFHFTED